MHSTKFGFIFFAIIISSCSQSQEVKKHKINPEAIGLNNQAIALLTSMNVDSTKKAITLLDAATNIDSNYFLAYYNKMLFLNELKLYGRSIQTMQNLIRIKPQSHDLYLQGGLLYEITGDSIIAKRYFQKSLEILNPVLDTMSINNGDYVMLVGNKAVNLIMTGDQISADKLLRDLLAKHPESDWKEYILSLMNKSKKELIESLKSREKKIPQ